MKKVGLALIAGLFLFNVVETKANLHKVEASFIVNFFRYIQWANTEGGDEFIVGVYGSHLLSEELSKMISGQKYRNSNVKVVELKNPAEFSKCSILFIPSGKGAVLKKAAASLSGKSTLIITEESSFIPSESVINFKVVNSKLTFSVNEENAAKRNISISSKLLAIASK